MIIKKIIDQFIEPQEMFIEGNPGVIRDVAPNEVATTKCLL
jgi:hypothetical protein